MKALFERIHFYVAFVLGGIWFLVCSGLGSLWLLVKPHNRQTLYVFGKVFCAVFAKAMGWRVEVEHRERLEDCRPCVIVANHQSFLDVVTYGSMFPRRTVSAGKREIGRIPLFGWFYRLSGNLVIDRSHARSAHDALEAAAKAMADEKISLWFMPEGHRNKGRELLPFKTGAFRLAADTQAPIVPVVAEPLDVVVDTRRLLARRGTLRIRVLPAVPPPRSAEDEQDVVACAARVRGAMQTELDSLRATASDVL